MTLVYCLAQDVRVRVFYLRVTRVSISSRSVKPLLGLFNEMNLYGEPVDPLEPADSRLRFGLKL